MNPDQRGVTAVREVSSPILKNPKKAVQPAAQSISILCSGASLDHNARSCL